MARGRSWWPDYWDVSCHENTGLWLVNTGHVTRILGPDWSVWTHDRYSAFQADTLHTNLSPDTSFSIFGCLSWSIFRASIFSTFQSQCLFNIFNSVGLILGSASCWWQAGHFEEMRINSLSSPYLLRTLYREGIIFLENYNLGLSSDLTDKQNDDN